MLLAVLSVLGIAIGFVALVLSIATVLYYVSEQLEEHTVPAKRYITRYIYSVMTAFVLLYVTDGLSLWRVVLSLATNYMYLLQMRAFPAIDFTKPSVLAGCVGTVATHVVWFNYFGKKGLPSHSIHQRIPNYQGETLLPFSQVASFFGLLVWTVPLLLFLSLSANDQVLPFSEERKKPREGLAKKTVASLWQALVSFAQRLGINIQKQRSADLPL